MAERPYTEIPYPDWRTLKDEREKWLKEADEDIMGYPLSSFLAHFTPAEIAAAKAMSAVAGYAWDAVGTDPRVTGRKFLDFAKVALRAAAEIEES